MRVRVLIGGNDDYHDLVGAGTIIREALLRDGFEATMHVGWGEQQRGGDETKALVMYTNGMRMTPEEQEAVAARIAGGLGLVAIHTCSVVAETPEFHARWLSLIGCRFVHHPPHAKFTVRIDKDHPVTQGLRDFEIEDELYITEPVGDPMIVLASASFEGKKHPMVSIRESGRTRVCCLANGHDARALGNPSFQKLLANAVRWAARG